MLLKRIIIYYNILSKGMCDAKNLIVSAPSENNKKPWRELGVAVTTDNSKFIIYK